MRYSTVILVCSFVFGIGLVTYESYTKYEQIHQILDNFCDMEGGACHFDTVTNEKLADLLIWASFFGYFKWWIAFWLIVSLWTMF